MNVKTHIIIGNSAAGIAAIRTLRKLDAHARIICISEEPELPYNKCFIADYVAGTKTYDAIITLTQAQQAALNVQMLMATRVVAIMSDNKSVMLSSGQSLTYDTLLIATGSRAVLPPITGLRVAHNCMSFATAGDAYKLRTYVEQHAPKHALVIGAGLSGLEVADALTAQGVAVTVIEQGAYVLARHVPAAGAQLIMDAMQAMGVAVYTGMTVASITQAEDSTYNVLSADGRAFVCDLLVVTAGMRQNSELAQQAGIVCDATGIVVNEHMQTSVAHVYAAGDAIGVLDLTRQRRVASCTWPDAMQQGMHAAYSMCDMPKVYTGAHIIVSSAFFGLKFASCGFIDTVPAEYIVQERVQPGMYHRYLLCNDRLHGFVLVGSTQQLPALRRALLLGEHLTC